MSEAQMLIDHGTTLYKLKAVNVIGAAVADMKLKDRKGARDADPFALYSFARQHVRAARSVSHLIAIAYFGGQPPTIKRSTLLVYKDRALLRQCLINLLQAEN
jgi:hypothetical protein